MGGLAVQRILAISSVGGSTPEASGTALVLRGSNDAMRPPAFPEQRAEFIGKSPTELYVPAPRPEWLFPPKGPTVQEIWPGLYKEMVKGSEEKGQASKNSLQEEAQETYNGETSSEQAKPDKNKSRKLLSSREEKIATVRASIDKLKENPEALQILEKMLNDKKERERSLLESDAARTRLTDEKSACHDPCSDTPASVNCIKECTTPVSSNPSACLDVSMSKVLAKVEPISGLQPPNQEVLLNYTLSAQNNCPQTIKDVTYHIQGTGGCPLPSAFIPAPASGVYIQSFSADTSSVAPGDSAGVKAGQDTSIISRCETYGAGFRITSSSLPTSLSIDISASGTDSTTNSQIYSQKKVFTVLGPSVSEGTTFCDQKCPTANPPATDTPSHRHKGPNAGAVAGGVIGGVSALALAWYCCSSRGRKRSMPDRRPRPVEPSSRPNDVGPQPRAVEPSSRPLGHDSLPDSLPSERMGFR